MATTGTDTNTEKPVQEVPKSENTIVGGQALTDECFTIELKNDFNINDFIVDLKFSRMNVSTNDDLVRRFNEIMDGADNITSFDNLMLTVFKGRNKVDYPLTGIKFHTSSDHDPFFKSQYDPVLLSLLPSFKLGLKKGFDRAYREANSQYGSPERAANDFIHVFNVSVRIPDIENIMKDLQKLEIKIGGCQEEIDRQECKDKIIEINDTRERIIKSRIALHRIEEQLLKLSPENFEAKNSKISMLFDRIQYKIESLGIEEELNSQNPEQMKKIQERKLSLFKKLDQLQKQKLKHSRSLSKETRDLEKAKKMEQGKLHKELIALAILREEYKLLIKPATEKRAELRKEVVSKKHALAKIKNRLVDMAENDQNYQNSIRKMVAEACVSAMKSAVDGTYNKKEAFEDRKRKLGL